MPAEKISLDQQITCVEREIAMRKSVYAHRVSQGKMKQVAADTEIARMEAVSVTLNWLRRNETAVREAIEAKKAAA